MKECIFTWSIENFSYSWHKTGESIISPKFIANPIHHTDWTLRLFPRGIRDGDYLSLFLHRETNSLPQFLEVNFELSCISADSTPLLSLCFPEDMTKDYENGFGDPCFLKRDQVIGRKKALYLPQDTLTLRCRMWKDDNDDECEKIFAHVKLRIERFLLVENIRPDYLGRKTIDIHARRLNNLLVHIIIFFYENMLEIEIYPITFLPMKTSKLSISIVENRTGRKFCEHTTIWFNGAEVEVKIVPFSSTVQYGADNNYKESDFELKTELVYSTGFWRGIIINDYKPAMSEYLSNYITAHVPSGNLTDYPSICDGIGSLYKERVLCDVELKTNGESLYAHKFLLCARSSVFLAMLTGEMKENKNRCVEIEEITADTLKKFLNFLYTDAFEDLETDAIADLYYAADKYQVKRLRYLCTSHLMQDVDVDNVCEFLALSDRHNDDELRRKANRIILRHDDEVFSTSQWKKLVEEQPLLAVKSVLSKYEENQRCPDADIRIKISNSPTFLDDLTSLYRGEIASDILIKTSGRTFPTHKAVLFASSSTFREMLTDNATDHSTECFKVEDLEDDTVSRILLFLYTDSLEDVQWKTAVKLYHAANVYQIQRLKFKCSCFLLENLRVFNACELLVLADEHRDVQLKSAVEDYIGLYDEQIFGSDEWAAFSEVNFRLANETMRAKYKKTK